MSLNEDLYDNSLYDHDLVIHTSCPPITVLSVSSAQGRGMIALTIRVQDCI